MYSLTVGRRRPGGSDYHLSPLPTKLRWYGGIMRTCSIETCGRKHEGLGYCNRHYQQFLRFGDPLHQEKERHGMSYTPEYRAWRGMKKRCSNKNNKSYRRYGGRGIIVCKRWQDSFQAFYDDMGKKPFLKATIDRIDNDLGYYKENCRWIIFTENIRNASHIKLTKQKANKIRKSYKNSNITYRELGLIYGVSGANICDVINNKIWI